MNPRQPIGLFFVCLLLLVACQSHQGAWERIAAAGTLRIGLDPTFPPFEVLDANGVYGLDIDLAQAVVGELDLQAEFIFFGYDGLYDALATEQVDVLISAVVIAPERTRDFAYSEPYFNAGEILIVPANTSIETMTDMNGRRLAVELGAQGHVEATDWSRRLSDLTIQPYNSPDEALTAVANGEADAVLIDSVSGRLFLADQPHLKRLPTAVTIEPYAFVVRIEDEILLKNLNQGLQSLQTRGELEAIIQNWLGS